MARQKAPKTAALAAAPTYYDNWTQQYIQDLLSQIRKLSAENAELRRVVERNQRIATKQLDRLLKGTYAAK